MSSIYYWKNWRSQNFDFLKKKNLKKFTSFEEQKGTSYVWGNVYFGIIVFSCLSSTKPCLRFLLICFVREIKDLSEFLRKWGWFHGNQPRFLRNSDKFSRISWLKLKFQKIETRFWKSNYCNDINIFLSLEKPCTFFLAK